MRIQPIAEWERDELGRALARRDGLSYVREPATFKGRCFACGPAPAGVELVRVVDEAGRRFTLIPKPAADLRFEGRTITLARNERGRLVLEPDLARSR